jgi:hypothetical protein
MLEDEKKGILLESGTNEIEVMEFTIDNNLYGINVAKVKEILVSEPVKPMPHVHSAVEGIFKPRDIVITVVDLPKYLLGKECDKGEKDLFMLVTEFARMKDRFSKVEAALRDVEEKGYGIVMPSAKDLTVDEPKLSRQPGGYGVKVTAHAESIHMIKTGIKTELCPVVGTVEQSEEVVKKLCEEYEEAPERVLEYNMFGRSLYDMVSDSMNQKMLNMPEDSREKLGETLGKIINDGSNGLICILL